MLQAVPGSAPVDAHLGVVVAGDTLPAPHRAAAASPPKPASRRSVRPSGARRKPDCIMCVVGGRCAVSGPYTLKGVCSFCRHLFRSCYGCLRSPRFKHGSQVQTTLRDGMQEFGKFIRFHTVLGGYLPWLMRACGWLRTSVGGLAAQIAWRQWAERLESRMEAGMNLLGT